MIKNPQMNAIFECVHQVLAQMLCTAELNMAKSVTPNDVDVFLDNEALPTTHALKPLQTWQFGHNMLFNTCL